MISEQAPTGWAGRTWRWIDVATEDATTLRAVFDAAHAFFEGSVEQKEAFRATSRMTGWREIGVEYSQSPERPDLNETFCYRAGDEPLGSLGVHPVLDACRAAHVVFDRLAGQLLADVGRCCGVSEERVRVRTASESWLQINFSLPARAGREFIQESHEDGHLVTLLMADAVGLEVFAERAEWTPLLPRPDRLVCFGGECGALLTGDTVLPMPHQVRAHRDVPVRVSVAYFVNPDLDQELAPWRAMPRSVGVDLLRWGQQNPVRFGLPAL